MRISGDYYRFIGDLLGVASVQHVDINNGHRSVIYTYKGETEPRSLSYRSLDSAVQQIKNGYNSKGTDSLLLNDFSDLDDDDDVIKPKIDDVDDDIEDGFTLGELLSL